MRDDRRLGIIEVGVHEAEARGYVLPGRLAQIRLCEAVGLRGATTVVNVWEEPAKRAWCLLVENATLELVAPGCEAPVVSQWSKMTAVYPDDQLPYAGNGRGGPYPFTSWEPPPNPLQKRCDDLAEANKILRETVAHLEAQRWCNDYVAAQPLVVLSNTIDPAPVACQGCLETAEELRIEQDTTRGLSQRLKRELVQVAKLREDNDDLVQERSVAWDDVARLERSAKWAEDRRMEATRELHEMRAAQSQKHTKVVEVALKRAEVAENNLAVWERSFYAANDARNDAVDKAVKLQRDMDRAAYDACPSDHISPWVIALSSLVVAMLSVGLAGYVYF